MASTPSRKRPSEINKYVTGIIYGAVLATVGFFLFSYFDTFNRLRSAGIITVVAFVLAFLFNSIFQVVQKCPYNPVAVSISSAMTTGVIFFTAILLYIPVIGEFLIGIVESAFPYTPVPISLPDDQQAKDQVLAFEAIQKDKHRFAHAYAYWMFWGGLLPMYTLLGLIGSC